MITNYNQFKKAIERGEITSLKMVKRVINGVTEDIPPRLQGVREIHAVRSYGLDILQTHDTAQYKTSRLEIKASQCSFFENTLTIDCDYGTILVYELYKKEVK